MLHIPGRPITVTLIILIFALIIITVQYTDASEKLPEAWNNFMPGSKSSHVSEAEVDAWTAAQAKYKHLADDKFTIALQTYRRPKEFNDTISALLSEKIPSLQEIVVVWNDIDATPPKDYTSDFGVPVRFRKSTVNSLNQKLWPDPKYKTQAVLLSDDDVYYRPEDLEFAFQTWRKFGRNRLTGALARCAVRDSKGAWRYTMCTKDHKENNYAMILTNLCFSHISFMEHYSSEDETMVKLRGYIDEHFNCEDIALNYVSAHLTREGPLLVNGEERYVSFVPRKGISSKPGHLAARSKCLNDFENMFGYMPLVNETGFFQRGVYQLAT